MSLIVNEGWKCIPGFPRVSGDEPHAFDSCQVGLPFSPRERG